MRPFLLASVFVLFPLAVSAQTLPPTLTLAEAQRIALTQQPQVKAGDLTAQASEQSVAAARAAYFPQISGNAVRAFAGDNTRIAATTGLSDPTIINRASAGIAASQLITDFGKTNALVDASRFAFKADQARSQSARDQTLFAVTRAYYSVLQAQALLQVAEETKRTRGAFFDQVKALHGVKMKSDLDLSMAEQGVQEADLLELKAKGAIQDGMTALSLAMGITAAPDFTLEQPATVPQPPAQTEDLVDAALANNPEMQAGKADVQAARARAKAQAREFMPTLTAYSYAGDTTYREPDNRIDPEYATAGVNLSMNFYTGGRISAQSAADRLRAEASARTLDDRRNQIVGDIRTLCNDARTTYQNIALTADIVKNADQSYTLTQARYKIGNSSIVDLVEAQLAETQAEIEHSNAKYDYLLLLAQINYIVGEK